MYSIFIYLSVDGYLGYFHVLAIINSATLGHKHPFKPCFSPNIQPGVGLLDHREFFRFLKNPHIVLHRD